MQNEEQYSWVWHASFVKRGACTIHLACWAWVASLPSPAAQVDSMFVVIANQRISHYLHHMRVYHHPGVKSAAQTKGWVEHSTTPSAPS